MDTLPKEIVIEICSYLLERDIISVYQTNKKIKCYIMSNELMMKRIQSYISVQKEPFLSELYKFVSINDSKREIVSFLNDVKERPYGLYFILFLLTINESKYKPYSMKHITGEDRPEYFSDIIESKYRKSFYKNKIEFAEEFNPFDNFPIIKINLLDYNQIHYYYHRYVVPMNMYESIYIENNDEEYMYIFCFPNFIYILFILIY